MQKTEYDDGRVEKQIVINPGPKDIDRLARKAARDAKRIDVKRVEYWVQTVKPNERCPCGSKRKFSKCCMPKPPAPDTVKWLPSVTPTVEVDKLANNLEANKGKLDDLQAQADALKKQLE